jgi:hypothetical protein
LKYYGLGRSQTGRKAIYTSCCSFVRCYPKNDQLAFLFAAQDLTIGLPTIWKRSRKSLDKTLIDAASNGLGQEKLNIAHYKEHLDTVTDPEERSDLQQMISALEMWLDSQHFSFLQDVNVGSRRNRQQARFPIKFILCCI